MDKEENASVREELFRLLTESSRDVIWAMDLGMKILYVSPSIEDFLGWSPEEYAALPPEAILEPDSLAVARRAHATIYAEAAAGTTTTNRSWQTYEALHRRKDSRHVWGEVSFALLLDDQGRARGFHGTTRDIRERQLYEKALRESEAKYRRLVEMIPIGIFDCDLEGKIHFINEAAHLIGGYAKGSLLERRIESLLMPEEWPRVAGEMRRVAQGEAPHPQEYLAVKADGSVFPIEIRAVPLSIGGHVAGFRGIILDVSDRKRLEAENLKTNRLEAVGLLAGGIAHDFNNLLTVIMGNLNLARLRIEDDCPAEISGEPARLLGEAERAVLRARSLTQQLIAFSRGGAPIREMTDLGQLLGDFAGFITQAENSVLEVRVESGLPKASVDRGQIFQLVQNLVINAAQAMPEGGSILLRLSRSTGPGIIPSERQWLCLEVSDEGRGVPPELRDRVFEPYFTTKETGSGLGLAICFRVARSHGGTILVEDAEGGGALFRVFLPTTEEAFGAEGTTAPIAPSGGSRRILLVEDEESISAMAAAMAERAGYVLVSTDSGDEACALWENERWKGQPFDLMILDMQLGKGEVGLRTFDRLKSRDPEARIIVSSGYSDEAALSTWRERGFFGILRKPYSYDEFFAAAEGAFARDGGRGRDGV